MSSRRRDILLHEAREQLRGGLMQNIDDAHFDHQSHQGDSERLGVGLEGPGSVSRDPWCCLGWYVVVLKWWYSSNADDY